MTRRKNQLSLSNKTISCCYQCEKREVGCHGTCNDYIKEVAERKEFLEKVRLEKAAGVQDAMRILSKREYFCKKDARLR